MTHSWLWTSSISTHEIRSAFVSMTDQPATSSTSATFLLACVLTKLTAVFKIADMIWWQSMNYLLLDYDLCRSDRLVNGLDLGHLCLWVHLLLLINHLLFLSLHSRLARLDLCRRFAWIHYSHTSRRHRIDLLPYLCFFLCICRSRN